MAFVQPEQQNSYDKPNTVNKMRPMQQGTIIRKRAFSQSDLWKGNRTSMQAKSTCDRQHADMRRSVTWETVRSQTALTSHPLCELTGTDSSREGNRLCAQESCPQRSPRPRTAQLMDQGSKRHELPKEPSLVLIRRFTFLQALVLTGILSLSDAHRGPRLPCQEAAQRFCRWRVGLRPQRL